MKQTPIPPRPIGRNYYAPGNTTVLFVRRVPKQLKANFKAVCARRNRTMHSALIELMRDAVQRDAI
jgi:hypothetical protein